MKALHRTKALAAYEGARLCLKKEMPYPTYMMLKEAARGALLYIIEDKNNTDISDKISLTNLLEMLDVNNFDNKDIENIKKLIELEENGLSSILSVEITTLKEIKKSVKYLIGNNLKESI